MLNEKNDKRRFIGNQTSYSDNSIYLVIDDDTLLKGKNALPRAVALARKNMRPIIGDVEIDKVYAKSEDLGEVLRNVVNVYFRFKDDLESLILTPRGSNLGSLMQLNELRLEQDYADQIWFASLVLELEPYRVPAISYIEVEPYPSNAREIGELQNFLESEEKKYSSDMFNNLLPLYREADATRFSESYVLAFIEALESKDFKLINESSSQILAM